MTKIASKSAKKPVSIVDTLPHGDTSWFQEARFGMFIHWGLYAEGARHEWLMHNERIPVEEYERRYFRHFDPDLYDPEKWAAAASDAGMKYFVVTSKHHEGFCLWDTKYTNYKAPNTAAKRDLLRPLLDAMRAKGLHAGLYYSLLDWHHPQNFVDVHNGPYRDLGPEKIAEMNKGRCQAKYAKYMRDQVTELLTKYGPIDVMWFDFSHPDPEHPEDFSKGKGRLAWESEKLYALVRKLAPHILVDDRLDLPGSGDIRTPEQFQPPTGLVDNDGRPIVWEACQTFSGSWGYYRDEMTWRTTHELIGTLIDCVSKGGNLLLNVGPTGRGEFDARALDRLQGIGKWMHANSASIYGCGRAPEGLVAPKGCAYTYNAKTKRLYLHILSWPYGTVFLPGLASRLEYARFLNDHSELSIGLDPWRTAQLSSKFKAEFPDCAVLRLPQMPPAGVEIPVVELFLK